MSKSFFLTFVLSCAACRAAPPAAPTFTEIPLDAVRQFPGSLCLVFDDFDGDGRPDLFLVPATSTGDPISTGTILRNDVSGWVHTPVPFITPLPSPTSCAAGDYDNDGLLDVFVVGGQGNALLHNRGGLHFDDLTQKAGLPPESQSATAGAFLDYDRDGLLDLYVGRYGIGRPCTNLQCTASAHDVQCYYPATATGATNSLFRNLGNGTFQAVDGAAGAAKASMTNAVAVVDWDENGWPDLLVINDFDYNALYLNRNGQFTESAESAGLRLYNHGMGAAVSDFDGDGRWDLYVADLGPDQLWLRQPNGTVQNQAGAWGVEEATRLHSGWAPIAADFNQDGFIDLFVVNAALTQSTAELINMADTCMTAQTRALQGDFAFTNDRGASFAADTIAHSRHTPGMVTYGASAVADFDGDGDLDLAEVYGNPTTVHLLRNDTPHPGHWLALRLRGTHSNRDAIGAVISVTAAARTQRRTVAGATGSIGQPSRTAHFGLGVSTQVDQVTIRWPAGGVQTLAGPIAVDQLLDVVEP